MEKVGYLFDAITHDSYKKYRDMIYTSFQRRHSQLFTDRKTLPLSEFYIPRSAVFVRSIWILEHWILRNRECFVTE